MRDIIFKEFKIISIYWKGHQINWQWYIYLLKINKKYFNKDKVFGGTGDSSASKANTPNDSHLVEEEKWLWQVFFHTSKHVHTHTYMHTQEINTWFSRAERMGHLTNYFHASLSSIYNTHLKIPERFVTQALSSNTMWPCSFSTDSLANWRIWGSVSDPVAPTLLSSKCQHSFDSMCVPRRQEHTESQSFGLVQNQ